MGRLHSLKETVAQTGLFPAKASPTKSNGCSQLDQLKPKWTQSVLGCIPTRSVGTIITIISVEQQD